MQYFFQISTPSPQFNTFYEPKTAHTGLGGGDSLPSWWFIALLSTSGILMTSWPCRGMRKVIAARPLRLSYDPSKLRTNAGKLWALERTSLKKAGRVDEKHVCSLMYFGSDRTERSRDCMLAALEVLEVRTCQIGPKRCLRLDGAVFSSLRRGIGQFYR